MESNIIIFDFYGLPGCGKSTVSHLLTELYRQKGKRVLEPSYSIDHFNSKTVRIVKKVSISILWSVTHITKTFAIIKLLSKYSLNRIELLNEIINILVKAYYIQTCDKYDYLIFDEGLTQAIASMSSTSIYNVNVIINELEELICKKRKVIRIYQRESIKTALERINARLTNDSSVEKENSIDRRKKMMSNYVSIFDGISVGDILSIDGGDRNAQVLAELLYESIEGKV